MTEKIQNTKLTSVKQADGQIFWQNDEEHPIIIIDGKIKFYDPYLHCGFDLYVKGTKGRGVADADKLKILSDKHRFILNVITFSRWDKMTSEQILKFAEQQYDGDGVFKANPYKRTISELYRRKLLLKDDTNPPHYMINKPRAKRALETGKFED